MQTTRGAPLPSCARSAQFSGSESTHFKPPRPFPWLASIHRHPTPIPSPTLFLSAEYTIGTFAEKMEETRTLCSTNTRVNFPFNKDWNGHYNLKKQTLKPQQPSKHRTKP
ncbi:hypothetical protein E2C01_062144 [Portunus trituberculatus]|uniref:Uncharacterized protein n=1 Tax=Portunus trituberculatus TaxID=210409 RepID=A0A5B7HFB7_PORTR|nr:hypothetical protein [Portunus trituberculatus]